MTTNCAIKGCKKKGKHPLTMKGNFGTIIAFELCQDHYDNRDEYFEYVNEDGSVSKVSEVL